MKLPDWAKEYPHGLIEEMCEKYDIRPEVVYALIKVESGGDSFATRFEPGYTAFYSAREFAKENLITRKTEEIHQATSWGLMQVMGGTARRLGLEAPIPVLIDPANNIEYGCKLLADIKTRYRSLWDVVASYNAGRVRRNAAGNYHNQRYVDKVAKYYSEMTK